MRRRERSPFAVGAIVLVVGAIIVFLGVTKDIPFINEPYTIKAAFRQSNGIKKGSPVRIAGVDVGKVTKVQHTGPRGAAALVTMSVDKDGRPVHDDAQATIRPRIFLEGNFFIDLRPGTPHAPEMHEGATIPADRTANPVQLDQVLKALTADVRGNLQLTFDELLKTYRAGGAQALNHALKYEPAAFRFSAIVADALLGERPGDLGDLVRDQGTINAALDRDPRRLVSLVGDLNTTLGAFAQREGDLRAAIGELPRTLQAGLTTFAALDAAFPSVRRFAAAAVEPVRTSGPAAAALTPLVTQLRGLVGPGELGGLTSDLRAATPPTTRLSKTSVGLLGNLRELSSCTSNVLVPYGNTTLPDPHFKATGPVYEEIPKSLVGLAGESRSHDANGQWFKVLGSAGPQTLDLGNGLFGTTSTEMVGVQPPAEHDSPPLRPDVPCETQEPPDLHTRTAAPPATVRTNPSSPAAREREAAAMRTAVDVLRRSLRESGSKLKVSASAATPAQARAAARAARAGR